MKKLTYRLFLLALSVLLVANAKQAAAFHDPPLNFLFGNHIDTHQETRLLFTGNLYGYLYIIFTGETDPVSRLPIARHPHGAPDEICDVNIDCVVGWIVSGKSAEAKFLYHTGVNGEDHPVWLVNREQIPQPGSYTHFHWITSDLAAPTRTTDPRAGDIPKSCNQQSAAQLESEGAANEVCPGWFLQIVAVRRFAFDHGGEIIPVHLGVDNATHLNLVTNYDEVSGIKATR